MSFDRDTLAAAIARHGPVARVVVAEIAGSTPREVGAAMLVWATGQSGTIGGGTLEYDAAATARAALAGGGDRIDRLPLGPALGQCCGGAVTLLTEIWDAARLDEMADGPLVLRPVPGTRRTGSTDAILTLYRRKTAARNGSAPARPELVAGWMIEPVSRPSRALWIWGAGHVGRAIVDVLAPLPDLAITWVDTGPERFPGQIPDRVTQLVATTPGDAVRHAPVEADHLILTYSHAIDLDLCHRVLGHGFAFAGLIGSATKWARFRSRLQGLGHTDAQISRICCPIGQPELGKHPQAIAVGVAATLLRSSGITAAASETGT